MFKFLSPKHKTCFVNNHLGDASFFNHIWNLNTELSDFRLLTGFLVELRIIFLKKLNVENRRHSCTFHPLAPEKAALFQIYGVEEFAAALLAVEFDVNIRLERFRIQMTLLCSPNVFYDQEQCFNFRWCSILHVIGIGVLCSGTSAQANFVKYFGILLQNFTPYNQVAWGNLWNITNG